MIKYILHILKAFTIFFVLGKFLWLRGWNLVNREWEFQFLIKMRFRISLFNNVEIRALEFVILHFLYNFNFRSRFYLVTEKFQFSFLRKTEFTFAFTGIRLLNLFLNGIDRISKKKRANKVKYSIKLLLLLKL